MKVTRATAVVVFLFYIFLWVLALNGVSSLVPVLAVPLILAILVAFGVWLNRFLGITPRKQHFQDVEEAEVSIDNQTSYETTGDGDLSHDVAPPNTGSHERTDPPRLGGPQDNPET